MGSGELEHYDIFVAVVVVVVMAVAAAVAAVVVVVDLGKNTRGGHGKLLILHSGISSVWSSKDFALNKTQIYSLLLCSMKDPNAAGL